MSFHYILSARVFLTNDHTMRTLSIKSCTVRYRFGSLFAVDLSNQEYYLCRMDDLLGMTVQDFTAVLTKAFSFPVRKI
jgi:hypothetical protein